MEENEILHEIDPEGDIDLILCSPNPPLPFAVWNEDQDQTAPMSSSKPAEPTSKKRKHSTAFGNDLSFYDSLDQGIDNESQPHHTPVEPTISDAPTQPCEEETTVGDAPDQPGEEEPAVGAQDCQGTMHRFRLSSKHLTMASAYFKKMLQGPWKESNASTLEAFDWDPDAMVILMNIIHGRHRKVPRTVDLEMFAKIAIIADYYDCHEPVEVFAKRWIKQVKDTVPIEYCRELILMLAVCCVFPVTGISRSMVRYAMRYSTGPLQTMDLPIPQHVTDAIEERRQELVDKIIGRLHDLVFYFSDVRTKCSFDCSSLLLGALTKQLREHGLLAPSPTKPFLGYSVCGLIDIVRSFVSPKLFEGAPAFGLKTRCSCRLGDFTKEMIKDAQDEVRLMDVATLLDK
ncbi:hypothetical protein PG984_010552 [Apiospora sp. TS-2023a]